MMKLSSNISRPMVLLLLAGLVSAFVLVRTAWLCEDAYITFRTIDIWVNGYGLRWNVDERVQVYTHPLWMLALSAVRLATGEFYYATLGLSLMLSLSALALLATGLAATTLQGLLAVVLLTGSRAFVDFSSSGLENPLTHLLLLGHLWIFLRHHGSRRILWLTMTAAWLATNRPDTVLLVLPTLVAALSRAPWRTARGQLLVGALPLVLWEGFSIIYYGFPFPNTAYAKLGSGVAQSDLVAQGLFYLVDSLRRDPITISTIVVGIVAPWVRGSKSRRAMAAGAAIHLLYVVAIGGDFMSGRFLTPVLLASIAVLVSAPLAGRIPAWTAAVVALYLVTMPSSPLHSGNDYESKEEFSAHHGITDERGYWYQYTGLLRAPTTGQQSSIHSWARVGDAYRRTMAEGKLTRALQAGGSILIPTASGSAVAITWNVGFFGFHVGPQVHVVDLLALTDPLLARLPAYADANWRIGHFRRVVPAGYVETLVHGQPLLVDAGLRGLHDRLQRITRDDLFTSERWRAIASLNLRGVGAFVDRDTYRYPQLVDLLRTAMTVHQYDPGLHVELGRAYLEAGRGEEAVSVLERARLLRPDDIDIQAQVGLLAERYSLSALATQACGRAVDLARASQGGSADSDIAAVRRCAEVTGAR